MAMQFSRTSAPHEQANEILKQISGLTDGLRACGLDLRADGTLSVDQKRLADAIAGPPDRSALGALDRAMQSQSDGPYLRALDSRSYFGGHRSVGAIPTPRDANQLIELAFFGQRGVDPLTQKMWDWLRCIATSAPGSAHTHRLAQNDEVLKRALSLSDEEGGHLAPPGFIARIVGDPMKESQLYQYVTRLPVSSATGYVPKVGANCEVFWGTENTDIDESEPDIGQESWATSRCNAIAKMSRELFVDSNPGIVEIVSQMFAAAVLEERDRVIAIGSGSGRPLGLYSAAGITNVSITTLSYENLLRLKFSVDQRFHGRPSFRWQLNQNVFREILTLEDNNGRPLFRESPMKGEPSTILGVPFSIENAFPDNYLGIGDLAFYLWFDQQRYAIERTSEGGDAFRKHQVWIKIHERADGKPVLPPTVPLARTRVLQGIA